MNHKSLAEYTSTQWTYATDCRSTALSIDRSVRPFWEQTVSCVMCLKTMTTAHHPSPYRNQRIRYLLF